MEMTALTGKHQKAALKVKELYTSERLQGSPLMGTYCIDGKILFISCFCKSSRVFLSAIQISLFH